MKLSFFLLLALLIVVSCNNRRTTTYNLDDKRIIRIVKEFSESDWSKVYKSKDSLEALEEKSLPYLFDLINKDNRHVKLTNTADLIYPGATEFYGHGWLVDYDIDWITIRAGWAIEEITFQNFGFRENKITEEGLFELEKDSIKYQEYIRTGKYDFEINPQAQRKLKDIVVRAQKWWHLSHGSWTRAKGIQEALESNDPIRIGNSLQYLRFGNFCIKNLNADFFKNTLEPRIRLLSKSNNDNLKQDAELILGDWNYSGDDYYTSFIVECIKK
jgi:hypothetical protein